jgi:diguanylate cyclase (GGDEF)-like protein
MDTLNYASATDKKTIVLTEPSGALESRVLGVSLDDEQSSIVRDKEFWKPGEGFILVPDREQIAAEIKDLSTEQIADVIHSDMLTLRDVQEKLRIEDITGLLNMHGLRQEAKLLAQEKGREGKPFMVYLCDLNNMKSIKAGDEDRARAYLQHFTNVLHKATNGSGILANPHGSDEFIVINGDTSEEQALEMRKRIAEVNKQELENLSSDNPLYAVKQTYAIEAAVGYSVAEWKESELDIMKSGDKRRISDIIADRVASTLDLADESMYVHKDELKKKTTETSTLIGNETRRSAQPTESHRHLWFKADKYEEPLTKDQILELIDGKPEQDAIDIIEKTRLSIRELQVLLTTDEMTNLYNRAGLRWKAMEMLPDLIRTDTPFTVLVGDVNNLKDINDSYSHETGDAAISLVGRCLGSAIRAEDMASHPYGDELIAVLSGTTPEEAAEVVARVDSTIGRELSQTTFADRLHHVTDIKIGASFGMVHWLPNEADKQRINAATSPEALGSVVGSILLREITNASIDMQVNKQKRKREQKKEVS